ncbi:hypothetical protein ACVWW1_005045 [Bradyrhizobium sp. JR3.5]
MSKAHARCSASISPHPGEGELIIDPVSLGDNRHLIFAGTLERPVVVSGDILDHRKRVVPGIDNAFEEGHAVSDLVLMIA